MKARPSYSISARVVAATVTFVVEACALVVIAVHVTSVDSAPAGLWDWLQVAFAAALLILSSFLIYYAAVRLVAPWPWLQTARPRTQVDLSPQAIARSLKDTDYPCTACGYNLRGVEQPVCPECNAPIRLALIAPDAWHAPPSLAVLVFWLLITAICSSVLALHQARELTEKWADTWAFRGGASARLGTQVALHCLALTLSAAAVLTCGARLAFLFATPREGREKWMAGTLAALIAVSVAQLLVAALAAVFSR